MAKELKKGDIVEWNSNNKIYANRPSVNAVWEGSVAEVYKVSGRFVSLKYLEGPIDASLLGTTFFSYLESWTLAEPKVDKMKEFFINA